MEELIAYHNGDWKPHSQVMISPYDRGFTMGDVVFDVERTFDGKIFRLKEHIDRLYRSLQYYRIDCGLSMDEMTSISEEAVKRNEHLRPAGGSGARCSRAASKAAILPLSTGARKSLKHRLDWRPWYFTCCRSIGNSNNTSLRVSS